MSSFELNMSTSVITRLPKIEIHAHLHGSIRKSTLIELVKEAHVGDSAEDAIKASVSSPTDLKNCFQLFAAIHQAVQSKTAVSRVVREVLEDFMADNVIYLELRSTPRALADGTSIENYVDLVTSMIDQHNKENGDRMQVRLLVSLDRSFPPTEAQYVIDVAKNFAKRSNAIVGIDFSGNPHRGSFVEFLPAIQNARGCNLGVTLHSAEVSEPLTQPITPEECENAKKLAPFGEMDAIIGFRPERLGHAVKLTPAQVDELLRLKSLGEAPFIELCPTSNIVTLVLAGITEHPTLGRWLAEDYPLIICTDDMGVFSCSLSQEWDLVHREMGVSLPKIAQMTLRAIDYIFDKEARPTVRDMFYRRIAEENLWEHVGLSSAGDAVEAVGSCLSMSVSSELDSPHVSTG